VKLDVFLAGITRKETTPVTLTDHDLSELLAAVQAGEMTEKIRTSLAWVLQQLIEAELTATIGARPHERSDTRVTAQRNGHRPKLVTTAAGDIELAIPKLREGSSFPSLLERRRRIDRALFAVVMEAWVHGVHPQGRRPGQSPGGGQRDLEVGGLPDLRRARPRP
jgi:transposase-like protein